MTDDFRKWEFRVLLEDSIATQKLLNQWKHQYRLIIISVNHLNDSVLTILARREYSND